MYEIQELDVIFKNGNISLNLTTNSPDWKVNGKALPLTVRIIIHFLNSLLKLYNIQYYKCHLQTHGRIQSNMQFILSWKGNGLPTDETSDLLTFSLHGTLQPEVISFMSNTS